MEFPCCGIGKRWTVLALMLTFYAAGALTPECPDKSWHFIPSPDRCIKFLELSKKISTEEMRTQCKSLSTKRVSVDLVTIENSRANLNICKIMEIPESKETAKHYMTGLKQIRVNNEQTYVWMPENKRAYYYIWAARGVSNFNFCHNIVRLGVSSCGWRAFNCSDGIKYGVCQTYGMNPCDKDNGGCAETFICRYLGPPKSFECVCPTGFKTIEVDAKPPASLVAILSSALLAKVKKCVDIDECSKSKKTTSNNNICAQKCVNTVGSYLCECIGPHFDLGKHENDSPQCVCKTGFRLSENKSVCEDYNECREEREGRLEQNLLEQLDQTRLCEKEEEICTNKAGGYLCCGGNSTDNEKEICQQWLEKIENETKNKIVGQAKVGEAKAYTIEKKKNYGGVFTGLGIGFLIALLVGVAILAVVRKRGQQRESDNMQAQGDADVDADAKMDGDNDAATVEGQDTAEAEVAIGGSRPVSDIWGDRG